MPWRGDRVPAALLGCAGTGGRVADGADAEPGADGARAALWLCGSAERHRTQSSAVPTARRRAGVMGLLFLGSKLRYIRRDTTERRPCPHEHQRRLDLRVVSWPLEQTPRGAAPIVRGIC